MDVRAARFKESAAFCAVADTDAARRPMSRRVRLFFLPAITVPPFSLQLGGSVFSTSTAADSATHVSADSRSGQFA